MMLTRFNGYTFTRRDKKWEASCENTYATFTVSDSLSPTLAFGRLAQIAGNYELCRCGKHHQVEVKL